MLRACVLDGWPALQAPGDDGPIPLPLTAPARTRRDRGYVAAALEPHLDYTPEMVARLGSVLTPGMEDWAVPSFRSAQWNWQTGRLPATQGRRKGLLVRAVLLAVRADLEDGSLDRPGTADHAWSLHEVDRSDARKQRARGRRVLHRLGAWPWALVEAGRLPYDWDGQTAVSRFEHRSDEDKEFVVPLNEWATAQVSRHVRDLRRVRVITTETGED